MREAEALAQLQFLQREETLELAHQSSQPVQVCSRPIHKFDASYQDYMQCPFLPDIL